MALKSGTLNIERLRLESLYNTYLGMTPREQTLALVISSVIVFLVIILPIMAASGRIHKLQRGIDDGMSQLKGITREIDALNTAGDKLRQVESVFTKGFDASISTTLETLAGSSGIKDRIDSLKEKPAQPSDFFDEMSVDVRLKKVTLNELINYLYSVENDATKILRLKRLELKPRFDNKKEFDVSFQISTYRMLETAAAGE